MEEPKFLSRTKVGVNCDACDMCDGCGGCIACGACALCGGWDFGVAAGFIIGVDLTIAFMGNITNC